MQIDDNELIHGAEELIRLQRLCTHCSADHVRPVMSHNVKVDRLLQDSQML